MKKGTYLVLSIGLFLALFVGGLSTKAIPAPPSKPQTVIIGALATGTTSYTAALALTDLLNKRSNLKASAMPQTGEPAILVLLQDGAVHMGIVGAHGCIMANQGIRLYEGKGQPLRLLHATYAIEMALVAAADTNIHTIADVRGKRIPAYFKGAPEIETDLLVQLAMRGYTYKDIIPVPVTSWNEGVRAVIERKADVVTAGLSGSATFQELIASRGGVTFLAIPPQRQLRGLRKCLLAT